MIYPSKASDLVAKLGEIDPLGAARERLARMGQKIKKPDPPRRISKRRKYFLRHPDLFRKLGE